MNDTKRENMGGVSEKQIFISYPHNDENLESTINLDDSYFEKAASEKLFKYSAKDIKRIIEEAIAETDSDYKVWLDCDSIQAGTDFRKAIADGIASSAVVVMLLTSSYIAKDTKKWCNIERDLTYIYRIPFIPISMEKGCMLSDESVFSRKSQDFPVSHLEIDDSFLDRLKDIIRNGITNGFDSSIYDYAESYHLHPSCLVQDGELVLDDNNTQQMSTYVRRADRISDIADRIQNLSDSGSMPLFVCGESGSGKSELARAYADEFYEKRYLAEFEWDLIDEKVDYEALDFKGFCDMISGKENGEISSVFPFLNSKVLLVFHINDLIENGIKNIGKLLSGGACNADIIVTTFQNVDSSTNAYRLDNETDKDVIGEVLLKNFENNNGDRTAFEGDKLLKICRAIDFNMVAARLIGSHLGAVYSLGEDEFLEEVDIVSKTSGLEEKESWVDGFKHNNISASFDDRILTVLKTVMFKHYNFLDEISDIDMDALRYFTIFPGRWIADEELKDSLFPYNKSAFAKLKLQLIPKLLKFGYLVQKDRFYQMHNLTARFFLNHFEESSEVRLRNTFNSEVCINQLCVTEPIKLSSKRYIITKMLDACDDKTKVLFKMFYELDYSDAAWLYGNEEYNELAFIKLEYENGACFAFKDLTNLSDEEDNGVTVISSCGDTTGKVLLVRYIKLIPPSSGGACMFIQPDSVCRSRRSIIENRFAIDLDGLRTVVFANGLESIGEKAFRGCSTVSGNIDFPDTVKRIGEGAFRGCKIEGIRLPKSLEIIENDVFRGNKMVRPPVFPCDLKEIGERAFWSCNRMEGQLVIPDTVEIIKEYAFYGCSKISGLVLPDNVRFIGDHAFCRCIKLRVDITIDLKKTILEGRPFDRQINLHYVNDDRNRERTTSTEKDVFRAYHSDESTLFIDDGVEIIPPYAFTRFKENETIQDYFIRAITFDPSADLDYAFSLFESFQADEIAHGVRENIYLPDSVKEIGKKAFYYSRVVTNIRNGKNLEIIGEAAFACCYQLEGNIELGEKVSVIGPMAFNYCKRIESVHSKDSLREIGEEAFRNCSNLKEFTFSKGLKVIGRYAFYSCDLEELELPDDLEVIGSYAFSENPRLSGEISLPKHLTEIGVNAFGKNLKVKLSFGNELKVIMDQAFASGVIAEASGEIILPKSLEKLGSMPFGNEEDIKKITLLNSQTLIYGPLVENEKSVIFKGYPGSTAEKYATENGYKFEYIE